MTDDCSAVTHCRSMLLDHRSSLVPILDLLGSSQSIRGSLGLEGAYSAGFLVPVSRQLPLTLLTDPGGASGRMSVANKHEAVRSTQKTSRADSRVTLLRKTGVVDELRRRPLCSRRVIFSGSPTYDYPSNRTFSQAPDRKSVMSRSATPSVADLELLIPSRLAREQAQADQSLPPSESPFSGSPTLHAHHGASRSLSAVLVADSAASKSC